jgi:hypothetical protein
MTAQGLAPAVLGAIALVTAAPTALALAGAATTACIRTVSPGTDIRR